MYARIRNLAATAVLTVATVAGVCAQTRSASSASYRPRSDRHNGSAKLWISAVDKKGRPVLGLSKDDVRLYEDDTELPVVSLSRNDPERLTVGLLIDASWKHRLPFFRPKLTGSDSLAQPVLNGGGSAFVAAFADRLDVGQQTSDPIRFQYSVRQAAAAWLGARTALFDAIEALCHNPLLLSEGPKALVVVSDADDAVSQARLDAAVRSVELTGTRVFFLVTVPAMMERFVEHQPWMTDARDATVRLTSDTGGVAFRVHTEAEVDAAFEQIAEYLTSEYALTSYPVSPGLHRIRIRSTRRGVRILNQRYYNCVIQN